MSFKDLIKKSVLEGFSTGNITTSQIVIVLAVTFVLALYIFFTYRLLTESSFYDRNFNVSMSIISIVTAGIILAMQSNLVISLGMVGALSIVRFRTAIKEPMDLLFLFWSIGNGIICGAGLFKLAIIVSVTVTLGALILKYIPATMSPYLIVLNASSPDCEKEILDIINEMARKIRVDSKSVSNAGMDLIIEIKTNVGNEIVNKLSELDEVTSVSLLYHDGIVKS